MEKLKCAKCKGEMEEGVLTNKYQTLPIMWGTKFVKYGLIGVFARIKLENGKDVKALCCKNCGYLESYAK